MTQTRRPIDSRAAPSRSPPPPSTPPPTQRRYAPETESPPAEISSRPTAASMSEKFFNFNIHAKSHRVRCVKGVSRSVTHGCCFGADVKNSTIGFSVES